MWPPRRRSSTETDLQRTCYALQLQLLKANSELRLKTVYAQRLEFLLHQRLETIDQLNARLEQSREQVRHLDLQNGVLVALLAAPSPHDSAAPEISHPQQ
jgi:hypothetical protein